VLQLCNRVQYLRFRGADPHALRNLVELGIEPQLYGLRWTRLLFCREFNTTVLHRLWDPMLASKLRLQRLVTAGKAPATPSHTALYWSVSQSVEWVSTAMVSAASPVCCVWSSLCHDESLCVAACAFQLCYIRDRLVIPDYTDVMTALMRYPEIDDPYELFEVFIGLV
jgi:hypothetical protein